MYELSPRTATTPHNAFLRFWLSSGVVPFALFLTFWVQAASRSALRGDKQDTDAFRLPFLFFTLVDIMFGDTSFMSFWALLVLSVVAGSPIQGSQRILQVRVGNKVRWALLPATTSSETRIKPS
jgi:hypothetical protein